MADRVDVVVPKLNANDASYTLVEWLVTDGARVAAGDPVAVVETSKAAEELACEDAGFLRIEVPAGTECGPGQVIARLYDAAPPPAAGSGPAGSGDSVTGSSSPSATDVPEGTGVPGGTGVVVTGPARALAEQHGVDLAALAALGHRVVRRAHVEALVGEHATAVVGGAADTGVRISETAAGEVPGTTRTLSRAQQAVAATVVESHRQVPAAFAAVKVRVGPALALAKDLRRKHRCLIGLPELLVKAVAAQHQDFPLCFASPVDAATVRLADAAHVGLTIDVGDGLRVPVVHHAARLSWRELSTTMMEFRTIAQHGGGGARQGRAGTGSAGAFRPAQLAGGTITVALHNEQDVTFAVPLVFPGQVCAVSLPATQPELVLGPDGAVTSAPVVQLGLAYDHRVINGGDAVAFLQALKHLLGTPDQLAPLGDPPAPEPGA